MLTKNYTQNEIKMSDDPLSQVRPEKDGDALIGRIECLGLASLSLVRDMALSEGVDVDITRLKDAARMIEQGYSLMVAAIGGDKKTKQEQK